MPKKKEKEGVCYAKKEKKKIPPRQKRQNAVCYIMLISHTDFFKTKLSNFPRNT